MRPPFAMMGGGGGGSATSDENASYETLGFGTNGAMALVTAAGSINTKGSEASLGTTVNALAGIEILLASPSATARRFNVDLLVNGVVKFPNLFQVISSLSFASRVRLPLAIPAGATVGLKCSSDTASATIRGAIRGRIRTPAHPPMFTSAEEIVAGAATTALTATTVNLQGDYSGAGVPTYTQLVASLSKSYGALLLSSGQNGTAATVQQADLILAQGAAGSESIIGHMPVGINTAIADAHALFEKAVASGTRLAIAAVAPTPGTDSVGLQLHGFL